MEYYVLSRYAYWKYYILILYYRLAEYPPAIRVWAVFTAINLFLLLTIVIGYFVRVFTSAADARAVAHNREKYWDKMKEVALSSRVWEPLEISALLELPKNFKMHERQHRRYVPVIIDMYRTYAPQMNKTNWQRLLQVMKMPIYFEEQVRSRSTRKRIVAFKNVADMDANLK